MIRYYSQTTGCSYLDGVHNTELPPDAVQIPEDIYLAVIANPTPGKIRSHDAQGLPILVDPPPYVTTADELCARAVTTGLNTTNVANNSMNTSATSITNTSFNITTYSNNGFSANVAWFAAGY